MESLYEKENGKMRERVIGYFKDNKWWILTFLLFVIADTGLTMVLLMYYFGIEANPFAGSKMFDWSFHFWRIDTVIILIPLLSLTPLSWKFTRNWLLQGITVGYGWTVLNGLSIWLLGADIGLYQFITKEWYFLGVMFQFAVGMGILWVYRRIRGRRSLVVH